MPDLIVRDVEEDLVTELERRADRHGRTAEEEHREILREALGCVKPRPDFKEFLSSMPDVGDDSDFERHDDTGRDTDL